VANPNGLSPDKEDAMIVITGATGNIGSKISQTLLKKGQKIRCIARHADKLIPLTDRGAEAATLSLAKTDLLVEAFSGADTVFAMIPSNNAAPDFLAYQEMIGTSLIAAIEQTGVKYVVNLSSLGAHLPEKTGPIKGLHAQEQRLNRLAGVNILHLRPAYFMENLLVNVDLIKTMNIMGSDLRPDIRIPMIATRDIADIAARLLQERNFAGQSIRHLLGERDLSMQESARIIGRTIDRPDLKYVQFSYEDTEKTLTGMGFSADAAALFTEMSKALNEGLIQVERNSENTTPTSLEAFAQVFPRLIHGQGTTGAQR
jgi:uncharacterized protein YbjT (DUF2867 family)